MEKIYRVQMNSSGMPNFATAVEVDTDISDYSDKLWRNAYERGKADRPQGEWIETDMRCYGATVYKCSVCGDDVDEMPTVMGVPKYKFCPNCGARMKGAEDE